MFNINKEYCFFLSALKLSSMKNFLKQFAIYSLSSFLFLYCFKPWSFDSIQGVQEKLCFSSSFQHNASVQSLPLAGNFCTTNSSRVLARERWQPLEKPWGILATSLEFRNTYIISMTNKPFKYHISNSSNCTRIPYLHISENQRKLHQKSANIGQ